MCLAGACEQAEACNESAHQVQYLLASLDSFPRWRELDKNPIFTNSCFLIKVNEALGPLNHSFLIKGQPLEQEQDCLKLTFKFSPPKPHWKTSSSFISYMPIACFCSQRCFLSPSSRCLTAPLLLDSEDSQLQPVFLEKVTDFFQFSPMNAGAEH